MTSKHLFTLGLIGSGLALAGLAQVGCSSSSGTGTTTAATGSGGSKTTGHTASSSAVATGAGGGGGAGGGSANHDPADAAPIAVDGTAVDATLVDAMTPDFYTFNGTAGDRLFIEAFAPALSAENMGFDATITDLTLLLTGADMNVMMPLTYQDDGWPDFSQNAQLFVQLPATGAYYIQVADCNGLFSSGCPNAASGITNFEYNLVVAHTSKLVSPEVLAAGQDGTTAKAQTVAYTVPTGGKAGEYSPNTIGGDFTATSTTHVFSFTPPTDAMLASGANARAEFYVQPIQGVQGGDLSDVNVKVWVTGSDGTTILSQADQNNFLISSTVYSPLEFSARVTLGTQYFLFVEDTKTPGGTPAQDYYFISHYVNPLIDVAEKEGATGQGMNDTSATAEVLTGQGTAKDFFTVDGNISAPGSATTPDVDWFTFNVPTGVTQFQMQCDAARSGSGLGAFTANLFQADGTTSIIKMGETPMTDLLTPATPLPSGVTAGSKLFLQLNAATQDPVDTGTQYRCYVFFAK